MRPVNVHGMARVAAVMGAVVLASAAPSSALGRTDSPSAKKPPRQVTLKVVVVGKGHVTSKPARISCPSHCKSTFARGSKVKLTASAATGWKFADWSNTCGAARTCLLSLAASKTATATFSQLPPPPPGSSRDNPVPLGTYAPIPSSAVVVPAGWQMRINAVTPDATALVLAANMFNDPPAAGHQFFMFSVSFQWTGQGSADAGDADLYLSAVGASNVSYNSSSADCGVLPDPDYTLVTAGVSVFTGGTVTGNECFSIVQPDASSLVVFVGDPAQTKPVWFAVR